MIDGYYIRKIGQNRGAPRVWLEGTQTAKAGFKPGQKFDVVVHGRTIVLQANQDGSRVVSGKQSGGKVNPVIDLNSREMLAVFDGMSAIRVAVRDGQIYLLPLASELKKEERYRRLKQKLEQGDPITIGSLSHGGGILSHAIHKGLENAGVDARLAFANDVRAELLEHAAVHNDAWCESTKVFAAPMQELAFDERGVAAVPRVEVLEMGLPCSGASRAGKAKRGLRHAESHPDVGHLVVAALVILAKTNPACVVFENSPGYETSASADILRNQLRDMGYVCHERLLRGKEWGALEDRTRWCMVAVTEGIEFNFDQLVPPGQGAQRVGDVLDAIGPDDPSWSRMDGLKTKAARDRAAGKNFAMQVFDERSEAVGTMTKGYSRVRSTDPKLQHASNPELLRQFTPGEHARLKGAPEHLLEGLSPTVAHQVLGQGIVYRPFEALGEYLGEALGAVVTGRVSHRRRAESAQASPDLVSDVRIASLASEVVATLKRPDVDRGAYLGRIVAADGEVLIMDVGRGSGVVHDRLALDRAPALGKLVKVTYSGGRGKVEDHVRPQQISLGI
ncbi:MAG: DNA cytosine methyltransferase [Rhodococcus sp. (in: high G+C Gram-positive bacteria)]|uniref:DNA cytosine methyltransferase n=1 Tax=Rhodococcus sp. TaxID=1831 RepID=UPI002AD8C9F7|nr:DNA cytosine methyltransferase [Rhodococcus sp. (in: high G+C Gram-positive bacteria)]